MSRNPNIPEFRKAPVDYRELQKEWLKTHEIRNVDPQYIHDESYKKAMDGQTGCKRKGADSGGTELFDVVEYQHPKPYKRKNTYIKKADRLKMEQQEKTEIVK